MSFPENRYRVLVVEKDAKIREQRSLQLTPGRHGGRGCGPCARGAGEALRPQSRSDRSRHPAARSSGPRAMPEDPYLRANCDATHPDAQLQFLRSGQGARPQHGRRRLRHQAVRAAGADRAHQGSAAQEFGIHPPDVAAESRESSSKDGCGWTSMRTRSSPTARNAT